MPDKFTTNIPELLGDEADSLLGHRCETIRNPELCLPGPDFIERAWLPSDRSPRVLRQMQALLDHGRLGGTGYLTILPVDHGVEHSAAAAFAPNPIYFDPENIIRLARDGGCNAVASTAGVLGSVARRYAHRIPLILKLNHNELLSHPNIHDQTLFAGVDRAWNMGCAGVGATIYFGSPECRHQIREVSGAFARAHELGMFTMLWCYLRNEAFQKDGVNHERSADLTAQANHLGATLQADFVKQKMPAQNGGYPALNENGNYGKYDERIYESLGSDHPIDLTRYQVAHGYLGRCGLVSSGGGASGDDRRDAVRTAVINKRAGGCGLIIGRKSFQRPMDEGIELLHAIQDVYLNENITIA